MKAIPLLALLLAGCRAPAIGAGGGIVSTNPCADAMLIALVPPRRIAAISHYSQEADATSIPLAVARRFRATAGTAEEVIALKPDLVIASTFTPPATLAAYRRAGLNVLTLGSPASVAASKAQVMRVAAAVGEANEGRAMIARIDAAISSASPAHSASPAQAGAQLGDDHGGSRHFITATSATGPRPSPGKRTGIQPSALLFISGDLANGSGTLLDELLRRAGFRNAAADYGLAYTGEIPIETIAARPPDVILAPGDGRTASLRRRVLAATRARVAEADFPRALVNCGGPAIVPAITRLAAIRRALP